MNMYKIIYWGCCAPEYDQRVFCTARLCFLFIRGSTLNRSCSETLGRTVGQTVPSGGLPRVLFFIFATL